MSAVSPSSAANVGELPPDHGGAGHGALRGAGRRTPTARDLERRSARIADKGASFDGFLKGDLTTLRVEEAATRLAPVGGFFGASRHADGPSSRGRRG